MRVRHPIFKGSPHVARLLTVRDEAEISWLCLELARRDENQCPSIP